MKNICCTVIFLSLTLMVFAQDQIQIDIDDRANISLTASIDRQLTDMDNIHNWIQSAGDKIDILYLNTKSEEIILKGSGLIFLSDKKSCFQTEMHYTIQVKNENDKTKVAIKDIYYQSLPVYGKQGIPSVITYPSDWFSKEKLYRKSGKERWLNATVKKNTVAKVRKIINNALAFIN